MNIHLIIVQLFVIYFGYVYLGTSPPKTLGHKNVVSVLVAVSCHWAIIDVKLLFK